VFFGMNSGHRAFWPWWQNKHLRRLAWGYQQRLATRRRVTLAAACFTVAVACLALIVAVAASGLRGWGYLTPDSGSGYLQPAAAVFMAVPAMAAALWAVWGIEPTGRRRSWLFAAAAVAATLIAGAGYALFSPTVAHVRKFAGYRAVHLESGTSPLLPVILLL